jgi:aminoglycoside phosphotransferase
MAEDVPVARGYSGCPIAVRHADPTALQEAGLTFVLEKSASSCSYNARLKKQTEKQIAYATLLASQRRATSTDSGAVPTITVPRVLGLRNDAPVFVLSMAYVPHVDCLAYLSKASPEEIDSFGSVLVQLLRWHVAQSPLTAVSSKVFTDKIAEVRSLTHGHRHLAAADQVDVVNMLGDLSNWITARAEHMLPVGLCHGDLTLTNVLIPPGIAESLSSFRDAGIILIDFLDCFIETPLADLAKLGQDLVYGWSLRMAPTLAPPTAAVEAGNDPGAGLRARFANLWQVVSTAFDNEAWYRNYFRFFFTLNQLRVLMYTVNDADCAYLLRSARREFAAFCDEQRGQQTQQNGQLASS